jgi:hypothetical protein
MKNLKIRRPSKLVSLMLFSVLPSLVAQDQVVSGNLEVAGRADIVAGPLSLGEARFYDENNVLADPAQGLTIHYSETPQNWSGSTYVKGKSSVRFQVAQESADFKWQFSEPNGFGEFGSVTLMQLSNDGLTVNGQKNTLPNQTLSEGSASILTLGLADNRYLNKSGGTISGNLAITGSTLTVNGSNVLTETGAGYVRVTSTGEVQGAGATVTAHTRAIGIGENSVASGNRAISIGSLAYSTSEYSIALGREAVVQSNNSVGIGRQPFVSGDNSIGIGWHPSTHTEGAIAIGREVAANQLDQIVIGSFNEKTIYSPNYRLPSDSLFVVANGTAEEARSNALVVKRNGDMEVKGTSLTVNGLQALTSANATDFLRHFDGSYGVVGSYSTPWSSAIAMGHFARAGESSVAIGAHAGMWEPGTSGVKSVAIGYIARAPGEYSVSIGEGTWASHDSVTIGRNATTYQSGAIAIGRGTIANHPNQVVLGAFNIQSSYAAAHYPTNDLLVLGNGTADDARSNALIVKRNGNMEVKGTSLTVNGLEVVTEDALDAAIDAKIEDFNLGNGNYISRNGDIGMIYGTTATAAAHSMALGQNTTASGSQSSSAIGYYARANQQGTHALGNHVVANRPGQIVLGNYNNYGSLLEGSDTPTSTDPVFVIGNGTADNARSNALVIKRDGAIELNGASLKYNNSNVLTEAGGYLTQSSASSTYLTSAAAASQYQPKLTGTDVYLTSTDLVAIQASIDGKLALADLENILGNLQAGFLSKDPQVGLAYGTGSTAIAGTSAIGTGAKANQAGAHAIGNNVVANRPGQVVVGNYNDYGTTEAGSGTESPTDPVFVVGTGKAGESGQPDVRKNALTVRRDGSVSVMGVIRVQEAGNLSMGIYRSGPSPSAP